MNAIRRMFSICALTILLVTALPSCAAFASALPGIIAAILDGAQVLDAIERFVNAYFIEHPDPAAQAKVTSAMVKCRSALNIALRSAHGAKDLDEKQVDKAFDDFKAAYIELIGLCKPYGVRPVSTGRLAASPGVLEVPEPVVFQRGAR